MKRFFSYLMVMATLVLGGGKAMAQSVTIDGVVYTVDGDHAYVSGNDGVGDTIVVLGTVTIEGTEYRVTEIGYHAFYRLTEVLAYTLPDGIISIGTEAFYDNYELKTINLPSTVESIGHMAFGYNWDVQITELPTNLKTLDSEAFRGCQSATFTKIPDGVTHIPSGAFRGCYSLTSLTLPEGLTRIDDYAFEGCSALSSINFPNAINYVGTDAFANTSISFPAENGICYVGLFAYALADRSLSSYVIKEGTTSINSSLFTNCTNMTSITIPNSVVSIGENAFEGCTGLPIENGVRYADSYAVEVADKTLTEYTLKDNVRFLGNELFRDCSSMTSVNVPSGVTSIGDNTFYGCSALTSLVLPETVSSIGAQAFYNCSSLTSVNIPSGITSIGNSTFYGCSALTSLILPETVSSIGAQAFYNCSSLTSVNIPSGVTTIYGYTFYNCSSVEYLSIPESVVSIEGGYNFWEMTSLKTLELKSCLNIDGYYILSGVDNLEKLVCHSETPPLVNYSYYNSSNGYYYQTSLPSTTIIYAPKGYYNAYKEAYSSNIVVDGEAVSVEVNLTISGTLGEELLKHVEYLREINSLKVNGSMNEADINCINSNMPNLIKLDLTYSNMEEFTGMGHSNIVSLVLPKNCKKVSGPRYYRNLRSVTLPEGLVEIADRCFEECNRLEDINVPSSLKKIGATAFYGTNLKNIQLNDSLTFIGSEAFANCSSLKNISLKNNVTDIGWGAFSGCSSLESFKFPTTLKIISARTFEGCASLTSIELHDSIISIEGGAFRDCNITSVDIPRMVKRIGESAFNNCKPLTRITLHEGLESIGSYAFYGCDSLKTIELPASLQYYGGGDFGGESLKKVVCRSFFPPIVNGGLGSNKSSTLYVPSWTLNRYKLAAGWSAFASIEPIDGVYPDYLNVYKDESLDMSTVALPEGYRPNLDIKSRGITHDYDNHETYYVGKLIVRGEGTLPLSSFKMQQTRDANTMTSLVNYGTLTADNVVTDLNISTNNWHFLTFPYDVKVSDIATVGNWVISRYDGAARAKEDFGNTWKTLPYDSILHAGEGYIWHSQGGNFTVPAMDNENKNLIFANDTRYIQLKENPSATEANYGWNLIGNPYPCFYDTRFMDFTSPITVRSGNSYAAYSPVDDSYILSPLEAFFVQCSAESNVVGFYTEGRQTDNTVRTLTSAPSTRTASERSVLNLYLESNAYADHTRLVVNEGASLAYEMACDAAKFMSDDATVPQLFTIEGGERMAINERPLANGKVALGIYIGKAGNYTLSLDTKAMDTEVFLVDKLQGTETDLTTGSYVFTTEAGTFTDRFEIRLKRTGVVDGIEAVAAELKVEATADGISVSNATTPIYIYNATGALIDIKTGNAVTFDVPQGVYVVKVGDNVHKVVVK